GIEHIPVNDWAQFAELIHVLPTRGVRILEVKTDRKADAAMRKQIFGTIAASLTEPAPPAAVPEAAPPTPASTDAATATESEPGQAEPEPPSAAPAASETPNPA